MVGMPANTTLLERSTSPYYQNNNLRTGLHTGAIFPLPHSPTPIKLQKFLDSSPQQCSEDVHTPSLEGKHPPSISEWLQRIGKIAEIEDLVHQARETHTKFCKT